MYVHGVFVNLLRYAVRMRGSSSTRDFFEKLPDRVMFEERCCLINNLYSIKIIYCVKTVDS